MNQPRSIPIRTSDFVVRKGAEVRKEWARTTLRTLYPPFRGGIGAEVRSPIQAASVEVRKASRCGP